MRLRTVLSFLAAVALAAAAGAQTKTSGTIQCGKPDPQHAIEAGDKTNHMMGVGKSTCTWSKPMEIEGSKSKDGYSVSFDDSTGNKYSGRGVHVTTMDSGDKIFVKFQGGGTVKDGALQTDSGTWSYTGGTGKLKGIKGKGTYKGKGNADGTTTYEIEGDYQASQVPRAAASPRPSRQAPPKRGPERYLPRTRCSSLRAVIDNAGLATLVGAFGAALGEVTIRRR